MMMVVMVLVQVPDAASSSHRRPSARETVPSSRTRAPGRFSCNDDVTSSYTVPFDDFLFLLMNEL